MQSILEEPPHAKENTKEEDPLYERARALADSGDIFKAMRSLEDEELLGREVERVKQNDDYAFLHSEAWMREREWRLFTCIELYDHTTAHHCFNTFVLLKEKLDGILQGVNDTPVRLLEIIRHNDAPVLRETLLRAALLHDIGKLALPRFLIESTTANRNDTLATAFPNVREQRVLVASGFSPEETFFDALKIHERKGAIFLENLGFAEEATLAGSHHNYDRKTPDTNDARDVLRLGATESGLVLGDLIHLADVEEALTSNERTYKKSMPLIMALAILTKDASGDNIKVSPFLTYLWVKNELAELLKSKTQFTTEEEREAKAIVDAFLKETEKSYSIPLQRAA